MTPRHRTIRYAERSCHRGGEERRREREEKERREKRREGGNGHCGAVMQRNSAPVTRGDLAMERAERRARGREIEREREREWTRGLFRRNEPITPRDRCYLFIILLNVDRRGAKASGSFLQHGHCSEIFVWFNEHAWVALRSPSFDSTKTLLLTASQPSDKTCTLCANGFRVHHRVSSAHS